MKSGPETKRIKVDGKYIEGLLFALAGKNLIVLKGSKGYVMCGYLDLAAAEKFKDAAIKVTGVATIEDALNAKVHSLTSSARRLGARKGQPIKEAIRLIA